MENIFIKAIYVVPLILVSFIIMCVLILSKKVAITVFAAIILILMFYFINNYLHNNERKLNDKITWIIFAIMMSCMLLIQLILGYALEVLPSWDFGVVYDQASNLSQNSSIPISNYFAQYPNNNALLFIITMYYKVLKLFGFKAHILFAVILNAVIINTSVALLFISAKKVFGNRQAIMFMIMSFVFMPFYTYVPIFYTDTFSMIFISLFLYFFISLEQTNKQNKKIIYLILMGIALALGFKIKATVIINLVAVLIYFIIKLIKSKEERIIRCISIAVVIVTFVAGAKVCDTTINRTINITDEMTYQYKFPYEHWIMMALKENGFYDQEAVDFTNRYANYDSKKSADKAEIKRRVESYGVSGIFENITKKSAFTWGDGTYFAPNCLKLNPRRINVLHEFLIPNGKYYKIFDTYSCGYSLMLLLMFLYSIILKFRKPEIDIQTLIHITVCGVILFFFMWENCPRYILNFMGLFIFIDSNMFSKINFNISEKLKK